VPFAGEVAVVTGASSGIGAELSSQLAQAGARVGMLALPGAELEAAAARITDRGGIVMPIGADLADAAAVQHALARFATALGPVDRLIMSAGVSLVMGVDRFSASAIEQVFRVNVLGVVRAIEAVLPSMLQRRRGHLVVLSSLSSYRGIPALSAYCASKSAVDTLLEGLRIELRAYDVAVTTVRPGFIRTPMTAGHREGRYAQDVEPAARRILEGIAARRAEINFPWQPAIAASLSRLLPARLYDRLMGAAFQRARDQAAS
jgi:short-subunit dehydrogenase